jgi:hypothetical protein
VFRKIVITKKEKSMKIIERGKEYHLFQLGGGFQKILLPSQEEMPYRAQRLISACKLRTAYLNSLQRCTESEDATDFLYAALREVPERELMKGEVTTLDPGHIYNIWGEQLLIFVKKSNELRSYERDWFGIQTQEVMRLIIDLGGTPEKLDQIRCALFSYEVRAYRRKREEISTKSHMHDDMPHPRAVRDFPYDDVPFTWEEIEKMPIGDDGHVVI